METDAVISDCQKYRYLLTRQWAEGPKMLFVMLNPSTASHIIDDPTTRRCIAFAKREGFGGVVLANLFAFRTPSPKILQQTFYRNGEQWREYIFKAVSMCDFHVAAWGAHPVAQESPVVALLLTLSHQFYCLGKTKDGSPRHPLYVKGDQPFERYP